MASAWLRANRVVAAIFTPVLVGLAVVASDLVTTLLGERWAEVAPLLQILSIGMIFVGASGLGTQVFTALGEAKALFRFSAAETAVLLVAILAGVQWGVTGVAAAYASATILSRVVFSWFTTSVLEVPFRRYLASLAGVAQASLALLAATVGAQMLLIEFSAPAPVRLGVVIAVGVFVYVPICWWRVPDLRAEFGRLRRERLAAPAVSSPP